MSISGFSRTSNKALLGQDFSMLVANPRKEKMYIQVNDSLGFADLSIGTAEVNFDSFKCER